jgi:hypothetical protein
MVQHAIPSLVVKTMELYEIFILDSCVIAITSLDLWMLESRHDKFVLVINFVNALSVPCHVIMGLFEATYTSIVVMVA